VDEWHVEPNRNNYYIILIYCYIVLLLYYHCYIVRVHPKDFSLYRYAPFFFLFFWLPRGNAFTHTGRGDSAGYVGLTLFNGYYPLKPLGVSGAGITEGGSGSRTAARLTDPPSAAGRPP